MRVIVVRIEFMGERGLVDHDIPARQATSVRTAVTSQTPTRLDMSEVQPRVHIRRAPRDVVDCRSIIPLERGCLQSGYII